MAATTITRPTITDDSGNGTSGTILNAAWFGTGVYDKIDALFSYAGVTEWEASVAGVTGLSTTNTNTGTAAYAELRAVNSGGATTRLRQFGTGFTTSGANLQNGSTLEATGVGGLSILASHASGPLRFWAGNALAATIIPAGHLVLPELAANPTTGDLASDAAISMYTKADKLVFAYSNAGTMTYITLDLDGSDTTLTHGTTAP